MGRGYQGRKWRPAQECRQLCTACYFYLLTAQDRVYFSDRVEKNKSIAPGDHWQEIKRIEKQMYLPDWIETSTWETTHRPVGLGSQHDRTTIPHTTIHHNRRGDDATTAHAHQHTLVDIVPSRRQNAENEAKWGQTPPHREGHHHTGPFATVPLHLSKTSWRRDNTESEQLSTCGGLAASTVGLLLSRAGGLATPAIKLTLRNHFEDAAKIVSRDAPHSKL
jgi:hypothetical protein